MQSSLTRRSVLASAVAAATVAAVPGVGQAAETSTEAFQLPARGDVSAATIGKSIRAARELKGMTVELGAAAVGCTPEDLRAFERGEFDPWEFRAAATQHSYKGGAKLTAKSSQREWLREIGNRIKHAREYRGIPARYAAFALAIEPSEWADFENGKKEPDSHYGLAMAILLNVDPYWLCVGPAPLTPKRIEEIETETGKPSTLREHLTLCKILGDACPFDIRWGNEAEFGMAGVA